VCKKLTIQIKAIEQIDLVLFVVDILQTENWDIQAMPISFS